MNQALIHDLQNIINWIESGEYGDPQEPETQTTQATIQVLDKILEQDNIELLGHYMEHLKEFIELWCESEPMHDERTHKLENLFDGVDLGEFED